MGAKICELEGVREYTDGYPVELQRHQETGRLVVVAYNECHNASTRVDLLDLIAWLQGGPREIVVPLSVAVATGTKPDGINFVVEDRRG